MLVPGKVSGGSGSPTRHGLKALCVGRQAGPKRSGGVRQGGVWVRGKETDPGLLVLDAFWQEAEVLRVQCKGGGGGCVCGGGQRNTQLPPGPVGLFFGGACLF